MEDTDKQPGVESWWGWFWMTYSASSDMIPHCTCSIQARTFPKQGSLGSGFSCESWTLLSRWVFVSFLEQNHSSVLAIEAPDFFLAAFPDPQEGSPEELWPAALGAVWPVCRGCWKGKRREVHLWARPWQVLWIFFFFLPPLNFAETHSHTSGPSRAASLISPEGLLLLEIMRAWTSYQLYQESFFPAKLVRALLGGNLGLKLLFSYFTDGLNEWFTRRVKD